VECQKFLPGGLLIEHTKFNFNISDLIAKDNVHHTPNTGDIFVTGITLPGYNVSQAVARLCRLQLCAVLGSSGIT
jgi:hypothetical protein